MFIELIRDNKKVLVNVDAIEEIEEWKDGCRIYFVLCDQSTLYNDNYQEVKKLLSKI